MSLIGRLADAGETAASVSNGGSPMNRTALALESIGGTSRLSLSFPQRIALASQDINSSGPLTDGSPYVNAAANLEQAAGLSETTASPIERMIIACEAGFASLYLLDLYPTAFDAWEVSRITKGSQTQIVEVREDGGNTFEWILPDSNGDLDQTQLLAHTGANNGYVRSLMGGNGNEATETTAANQPQIVSNGNLVLINGKPSLNYSPTSALTVTLGSTITQPSTYFMVAQTVGTASFLFTDTGATGQWFKAESDTFYMYAGTALQVAEDYTGSQKIFTAKYDSTSSVGRVNGIEKLNGNAGTNGQSSIVIGNNWSKNAALDHFQSLVLFPDDQTANFAAIETYFNDYYGIYV